MLFELKDYDSLIEYSFKCSNFNVYKCWTKTVGGIRSFLSLQRDGKKYFPTFDSRWHSCIHFEINGCHMLIWQVLPRNDEPTCCFLYKEGIVKGLKTLCWNVVKINETIDNYYTKMYRVTDGIILESSEGYVKINMQFSKISYVLNNMSYSSVISNIVSKVWYSRIRNLPSTFISLAKSRVELSSIILPIHLASLKKASCYQYGEYYIYGNGPKHILANWNIKHVQHMSKNVRLYIKYILLCIQHKRLYKKVAKVLWLKYILPIVVFHVPQVERSTCIIS